MAKSASGFGIVRRSTPETPKPVVQVGVPFGATSASPRPLELTTQETVAPGLNLRRETSKRPSGSVYPQCRLWQQNVPI